MMQRLIERSMEILQFSSAGQPLRNIEKQLWHVHQNDILKLVWTLDRKLTYLGLGKLEN